MSRKRVAKPVSPLPPGHPDFLVRRDGFDRYFEKPLARTTFHDKVNNGTIIPAPGFAGYYLLNKSLCRMGLPPVEKLHTPPPQISTEDVTRLAFHAIEPDLFPAPSWLLTAEAIEAQVADHAAHIIGKHAPAIALLDTDRLKLAYFQGALDAAAMLAADTPVDGAEV